MSEPSGYRQERYDAPVPAVLTGAVVVDDEQAFKLWKAGVATIIDVMPNIARPEGLPPDALWQGRSRFSIPGAIWLPDAGFGSPDVDALNQFEQLLSNKSAGNKKHQFLFLCRADCWMSWNAAKRAVRWGYLQVYWYPDGSTGWRFWDWPVELLEPAETD